MPKFSLRLLTCLLFLTVTPFAAHADDAKPASKEEIEHLIAEKRAQMHPKSGKIELPEGHVTLNLPAEFSYLSPADAEIALHDIWGNPPGQKTLGIIMPSKLDFTSADGWAIVLEYKDDGHISDADAKEINYDELLTQMKQATEEANEEREKQGYRPIHLVGWAEKPYYDEATHKLYWAKEFSSVSGEHFLNYDIRALGREGVLVMSVLGGMDQLPMIHANRDKILALVDYNETHKYEDYNATTDRKAAYGLAALVAGGLAAKAGLFKGLFVALIALKKFVVLAAIAVVAFFKKLFGRNKKQP